MLPQECRVLVRFAAAIVVFIAVYNVECATPPPATTTTVPAKTTTAPASATTVPVKTTTVPASATTVPAKTTTAPALTTTASRKSIPPPTTLTTRGVKATISSNCLQCICQVEGCQRNVGRCRIDRGSLSCGPYQIKNPYWIDCGQPGVDFQTCTKQMACSETCVQAYMSRYGTKCSGKVNPTCEDYARIHNGGPNGCTSGATVGYWNKVNACCRGKPGGC